MAADLLRICSEAIEIGSVYNALVNPCCGAQLVFAGIVRDENEGRKVKAVNYEAFEPLALSVLGALAEEVRGKVKTPIQIVIIHRVGILKVGEVSTVVAVATPHRAESYQASRYLIEQLKKRLPVWKEEHYINGENQWLDGVELGT